MRSFQFARNVPRFLGALAVASGLAIVAGYQGCRSTRQLAEDHLNLLHSLGAESRRSERLDDHMAEALRRWEFTKQIAHEVIAGRLTLLEGAARFQKMNEENPTFDWEGFRRAYTGNSDEERQCRKVTQWVAVFLADRPQQAAEVQARLEAELRQYLASRDGLQPCPPECVPCPRPVMPLKAPTREGAEPAARPDREVVP